MTFDIIVLICALGQDPRECQPPTAYDQIYLGHTTNELMCGVQGQQHLAQAARLVAEGYYAKLICTKREEERS